MPLRNVRVSWVSDPDGFENYQSLNLYGFRGADFKVEKAPGTERIVFLGDSFVEGFGVPDDATIPIRFAETLADPRAEVLNLGVGAMQLPHYLALARVAIPLLRPDIVFLVLYANDLPELTGIAGISAPVVEISPTSMWKPRILRVASQAFAGEQVAVRWHRGPLPYFKAVPHPSNPLTAGPAPNAETYLLEAMRAGRLNPFTRSDPKRFGRLFSKPLSWQSVGNGSLGALNAVAMEHGAHLIVAYLPMHITIHDIYARHWNALGPDFEYSFTGSRFREPQRSLARLLGERGIPFIDPSDAIRRVEAAGTRLYHIYDFHLNEQGTALVGTELARQFRTFQMSPKASRTAPAL